METEEGLEYQMSLTPSRVDKFREELRIGKSKPMGKVTFTEEGVVLSDGRVLSLNSRYLGYLIEFALGQKPTRIELTKERLLANGQV